jgi:predicted regulator of Ras-like GTPase activity (Roadblock/LC7/MglB family)
VLVASSDGLLVAGEFDVTAPAATRAGAETLSAMAATALGIARMFGDRLALGPEPGCVVHGSGGCVAVQRVDDTDVLVLFGGDVLTVARLHLAMRRALPRVRAALAATDAPPESPGEPSS